MNTCLPFSFTMQYAKHSPTHLSEGKGSLQFRLVNMRADVIMGFLRGGQCQS